MREAQEDQAHETRLKKGGSVASERFRFSDQEARTACIEVGFVLEQPVDRGDTVEEDCERDSSRVGIPKAKRFKKLLYTAHITGRWIEL